MKIVAVTVRCKVKNSVQVNFYVGFSSLFLAGVKIGKTHTFIHIILLLSILSILFSRCSESTAEGEKWI